VVSETNFSPGPGGRLGYRLADGSFHTLTSLIAARALPDGTRYRVSTDEPGRTAMVTVRRTSVGARVSLSLDPGTGITDTFDALSTQPTEHYLGGGEQASPLDLRGQTIVNDVVGCFRAMSAPFYVSSAGYGLSLRTFAIAAIAFPGASSGSACFSPTAPSCPIAAGLQAVQICAETSGLTYDVFAGTPARVVSAYTATTGRPQLAPVSQFALMKWRDLVYGPAGLYQDIHELHTLRIPIGWVVLDNPWESDLCFGRMTFDEGRFPDPRAMIDTIHRLGVRFMLWISPLVRRQGCPPPPQYPAGALIGTGSNSTLDLTYPGVVATFEAGLRALISLGVDGFKGDRGNDVGFENLQLAGGPGALLQNVYPLLYERAVAAAIKESGKAGDFPTLFHVGSPGSSALVPGFWGGDQPGTFAGLQDAIRDGLSAGMAGYPTWGSDTGGYGSDGLTPDVFVRWAEFSAVSPVFEVGGTGGNATFWDFGEPTVSEFRDAAILHYELFPYLYELDRLAHIDGLPILRPLAFQYPHDASAWRYDLELMVGPSLLALPVTVPTGQEVTQYFPAGDWVPLWGGPDVVGPQEVRTTVPLTTLPLYLRAGRAIPFDFRMPLVWSTPWRVDALDQPGRIGWVYAPAPGRTTASSADERFEASSRSSRVLVSLNGSRRELELLVLTPRTARTVTVDGNTIARARTVANLRRRTVGWVPVNGRLRGIVVKVAATDATTRIGLQLQG
jgi:alpha-D-xyloside xylohydrolase